MTLDFPLMTLFVQLVPGNAKTAGTVQQTSRRGRKNRFSLKNEACQAPHRCYKSAPAYMSCVDNIPTVCAPWPLFSLCRVLVGLQLKHRALFFFLLLPKLAPFTAPSLSLQPWVKFLSVPSEGSEDGHES